MPATRGTLVESRNSYTVLLCDETLSFLFLFLKFFCIMYIKLYATFHSISWKIGKVQERKLGFY